MANFLDYLKWRGDIPLSCQPMNPVDALVLAWTASLPLAEPMPDTLGEAASELTKRLEGDGRIFAQRLADSRRFRGMGLRRLDRRFSTYREMQFAAVTILTGDNHAFVAFRGTDSTLVGWKENFNMAFSDEGPAQRAAVQYLSAAAGSLGMPLRVGGHSKGGNLAVYAAAKCAPQVQARLEKVYNFDGPGLSKAAADSEGYQAMEERLESYLPESSIVGVLLEQTEKYRVVASDGVGVMQHSPYSWLVTADGFVLKDSLDPQSLYAGRTVREWLASMSMAERERFVETVYDIVGATNAHTLSEIAADWPASGWRMFEAFGGMDLRTKAALFAAQGKLLRTAVGSLGS